MAKKAKKLPNVIAQIYNPENQTLVHEGIIDIFADQIETESGIYKMDDAKRYFDENGQMTHFIFNVDLPAKVEANNLKRLRRSVALNQIFDYDVKKAFDLLAFMPWVLLILVVLFK